MGTTTLLSDRMEACSDLPRADKEARLIDCLSNLHSPAGRLAGTSLASDPFGDLEF